MVKAGFTLLEVLVAMTLLAILLTIGAAFAHGHMQGVRDLYEDLAAREAAHGELEQLRGEGIDPSFAGTRPVDIRAASLKNLRAARAELTVHPPSDGIRRVEITVKWETLSEQPRQIRVTGYLK
jgi:prepilin-type N-terminal cleavage/methylation domain-containing protein